MTKEITVAEYMELVQGEGLLIKSMAGQAMTTDGVGSEEADDEESEQGEPDDEPDEDAEDEEEEAGDTDPDEEGGTTFVLTISTDDVDRINDVLNPMGCITDNFAQNPLFLYEHGNTGNGPLTNPDAVLGKINSLTMDPETKSIRTVAQYVPRTGNILVSKILDMERKGLIPGNSIGWRPVAGITVDGNGKRTIQKWELLEVSRSSCQ